MTVAYVYEQILDIMVREGTLRNTPMNERRYIAYIGVDNTIDLQFKNRDRKPYDITLKTVIWQMTDPTTGDVLVRKPAPAQDAAAGRARLVLLDHDTAGLQPGIYHVGVMMVSSDGITAASYTDLNYDARAEIELRNGAYEQFRSSATTYQFSGPFDAPGSSEALRATGLVSNVSTLNTAAVYMTNYTGDVIWQTSLEDTPVNWADIGDTASYSGFTGIADFNIDTRAKWLRIRYNPDPLNAGTIDRIINRA